MNTGFNTFLDKAAFDNAGSTYIIDGYGCVMNYPFTPANLMNPLSRPTALPTYEANEWSGFYSRYKVLGYKITVRFIGSANGGSDVDTNNVAIMAFYRNLDGSFVTSPTISATWNKEQVMLKTDRKYATKMRSCMVPYNGNQRQYTLSTGYRATAPAWNTSKTDEDDRIGTLGKSTGATTAPATVLYEDFALRYPYAQNVYTATPTYDCGLAGTTGVTLDFQIQLNVELWDRQFTI